MRYRFFIRLLSLAGLLFSLSLHAQQSLEPSDPRFVFREGIYLSMDEYKGNTPSLAFAGICDKDGKPVADIDLTRKNYYRDNNGTVQPLLPKDIFGYSRKGIFFIKVVYNGNVYFDRLVVIGNLSHFVCEVANIYSDPYGTRSTIVLMQFMLDYETGKVELFTPEIFEAYLKRDEALWSEFTVFSKKKKKTMMFLYLRKYNEKHPVYFPA
jgi:hypothetical protein